MLRKSVWSSSSFQCLSQKKSRAVQLRLASTCGNAAHLRDLFVFVAFDIMENENLSRSGRQPVDRLLQIHSFKVHRRPRNFIPLVVAVFTLFGSRVSLAVGLSCVQNDVDCETVQPCRESTLTSELRELLPGPHEHVLRELLALRPASGHPCAERIHPVRVCPVQPLE